MLSPAIRVSDIQEALATRIHYTWGFFLQPSSLELWFQSPNGVCHLLDPDISLYQVLGAYHPLWFREPLPRGFARHISSHWTPYVLRLSCDSRI